MTVELNYHDNNYFMLYDYSVMCITNSSHDYHSLITYCIKVGSIRLLDLLNTCI